MSFRDRMNRINKRLVNIAFSIGNHIVRTKDFEKSIAMSLLQNLLVLAECEL